MVSDQETCQHTHLHTHAHEQRCTHTQSVRHDRDTALSSSTTITTTDKSVRSRKVEREQSYRYVRQRSPYPTQRCHFASMTQGLAARLRHRAPHPAPLPSLSLVSFHLTTKRVRSEKNRHSETALCWSTKKILKRPSHPTREFEKRVLDSSTPGHTPPWVDSTRRYD